MSTTKRETRPLWVQANPRNARTSRLESYRVDRQTETEPTPIGLSIARGTHRMTDSHDKTAVSVCATNERFHIAGPDNLVLGVRAIRPAKVYPWTSVERPRIFAPKVLGDASG